MIVSAPPFDVQEKMFRMLSQRPGLSHQGSNPSTDGQVDAFDESSLNELSKAIQHQDSIQVFSFTPYHPDAPTGHHTHDGKSQLPTFALLDKLTIQQAIRNLPMIGSSAWRTKPVTEMSRDGVEISSQTIGGEGRDGVWVKAQLEIMNQSHSVIILTLAEVKRGQYLGDGIDGQPQPHFAGTAHPTIQLIHLDQGQKQVMKETVVEQRTVLTHAFQPACNGGFTMTRAAHEDRDIAPFSQEHQDQNDMTIVGLQSIKGSVKATGEALVAPLTFPILNMFVATAFSIADNGVQQVIDDAEVITQGIGTSVTLGSEMFGATSSTFALRVGNYIRFWLQDSQFDTRLAVWAVFGRSRFPFSGTIALSLLAKILDIVFESLPQ